MCGIAGIFAYKDSAPRLCIDELDAICESMLVRGPDSSGFWISLDQRIGLAHRRLAIIDPSPLGDQPMAFIKAGLKIVFNGEIYNFKSLRKILEKKGHQFFSNTDTEVLLHCYAEYGDEMVHHIRGMYAFAIWDDKESTLFLARDPFGIKPIYFSDSRGTFRFASQVKALLAGGIVENTVDPAGQVGFFVLGSVPEPYTFYKEIRSLEAGSTLKISHRGIFEKKFFCLTEEIKNAHDVPSPSSEREMIQRFRESLKATINRHSFADVPMGLFLSSGFDSSLIAALASELKMKDLHAMTLGFSESPAIDDEVMLSKHVASYYGIQQDVSYVGADDFETYKEDLLLSMDQPSIDGVNSYFLCKFASNLGFKVAFSGVGGDELLGGYQSFSQIPAIMQAAKLIRFNRSFLNETSSLVPPLSANFLDPKLSSILKYGNTYAGAYMIRRGLFMPWELTEVLEPEVVIQGWGELDLFSRLEKSADCQDSSYFKIMQLETSWYLKNQLLRDIDWASMSHSLEVRAPFVDIDLYRETLPLLLSNIRPYKKTMAIIPKRSFPKEIINQKKRGFEVPLTSWIKKFDDKSEKKGVRSWAKLINAKFSN